MVMEALKSCPYGHNDKKLSFSISVKPILKHMQFFFSSIQSLHQQMKNYILIYEDFAK